MNALTWNNPDTTPEVKKGTEELFWIAVRSESAKRDIVFLAYYQNRPLELDKDGEPLNDDILHSPDGGHIDSVGWVDCKEHVEFSDFYTPHDFDDSYRLLGWAEYTPPEFTGF